MKKFFFLCMAVVAMTACSDDSSTEGGGNNGGNNGGGQTTQASLVVSPTNVDFSTDGGTGKVTITSTAAWTAEFVNDRADDWCSIDSTSGSAGTSTLTITATANDTPDDRTASIVVKSGTLSKTINVSQKQKDALTVTSSKFEVDAEGGEVVVEVKANIDFEYAIDDAAKEWIKYEGTRAIQTSTLVFKVAKNDDTEKREGTITIKSGEFSEDVMIYQAGEEPSIVISQDEYTVLSDGETIAVEVSSNVDVAVEIPEDVDWIKESTTRVTSTNTYYFDITKNEDYDQRSAEISFTNKENNLSEVITITQAQKDAIVIAKDSYTIDSEGDEIVIEVGHNINFDVEISADWITRKETRAFNTDKLTFVIAENKGYDNREGTIVFKSKNSALSQIVKVYQAQKDAIIISKKDIVVSAESGTISFELQANVEFKVSEPNVDWLRAVTTRSLTTHTLHYEYDANTSYDSREAQIIVTDTKNNKSEIITITQAQRDAIVIANNTYTVDGDGGTIEIEVGYNVEFDVEIADDWITLQTTRAYEIETLVFAIAENSGDKSREGTIKFTSANGTLKQIITVNQLGFTASNVESPVENPNIVPW
ncbi:MAG: BACON domain-containing protein [Muribaculaceae bacterium]|nr:BACON domain-containing protein [Muribaculaceae bacterium]